MAVGGGEEKCKMNRASSKGDGAALMAARSGLFLSPAFPLSCSSVCLEHLLLEVTEGKVAAFTQNTDK